MTAAVALHEYKSHKTVFAAKITEFRANGNPDMPDLVLGEVGGIVALLPDWHQRHNPQVGGYFIQYQDGYQSYSPAKAFEGGYTRVVTVQGLKGDDPVPSDLSNPAGPLRFAESSDSSIEAEIQAKGLTAPRVTPEQIAAVIVHEQYFTARDGAEGASLRGGTYPEALGLLTFCVLTLKNGFTVTGESACASPENFDAEVGQKVARANAVSKIWPLEGYLLKDWLYQVAQPPQAPA